MGVRFDPSASNPHPSPPQATRHTGTAPDKLYGQTTPPPRRGRGARAKDFPVSSQCDAAPCPGAADASMARPRVVQQSHESHQEFVTPRDPAFQPPLGRLPPASKCQELIAPRDPAFQPPLGKLPPRTEAYRPLPHLSAAPGFPPVKGPEVYRPPGSCFSAAPQKLPPLPQMVVYRPLPHFSAAPGFPPMM